MRKRFEPYKDTLLLERAILDGKVSAHPCELVQFYLGNYLYFHLQLGNDRSALTSLAQLGDFSSAEAYCTLGGEVIPGKIALKVGEIAHLEEWARLVAAPRSSTSAPKRGKAVDDRRVKALLRILMEVYTQGGRCVYRMRLAFVGWKHAYEVISELQCHPKLPIFLIHRV